MENSTGADLSFRAMKALLQICVAPFSFYVHVCCFADRVFAMLESYLRRGCNVGRLKLKRLAGVAYEGLRLILVTAARMSMKTGHRNSNQ